MRKIVFLICIMTAAVAVSSCDRDDTPGTPGTPGTGTTDPGAVDPGNSDDNKDDDNSDEEENKGIFRPSTNESSPLASQVFEWTPAPGQLINETDLSTPEAAAEWAKTRLDSRQFVTLGGFGGYIIVGFDHSIKNSNGEYDFGIAGNAFSSPNGGSSEAGVVYVMQDSNGNGLPDDTWYELKGSDTSSAETLRDYAVSYFRPDAPKKDTEWKDNQDHTGCVDYLGAFHKQDYYYPAWVEADEYTLSGTCLAGHDSALTSNREFAWGYADNMGEDNVALADYPQVNRFRISDAIDSDMQPVELEYVDFIKVQNGINGKRGILGEISTEVLGFIDLSLY